MPSGDSPRNSHKWTTKPRPPSQATIDNSPFGIATASRRQGGCVVFLPITICGIAIFLAILLEVRDFLHPERSRQLYVVLLEDALHQDVRVLGGQVGLLVAVVLHHLQVGLHKLIWECNSKTTAMMEDGAGFWIQDHLNVKHPLGIDIKVVCHEVALLIQFDADSLVPTL